MTVLIDADGCPVVRITVEVCRRYGIRCIIFCDTAHEYHFDHAETVVLDKGADSVDYAIVNHAAPGDIVITQDYGLASMSLAKNLRILHQDGWEYTEGNIDTLLAQRHTAHRLRSAKVHMKGPSKRTPAQDTAFRDSIERMIQTIVHG